MDIPAKFASALHQPSVWALLGANMVTAIGVVYLGWSPASVLLLFWAESAVIGFYTVLKMLLARQERFDAPDSLAGKMLAGAAFAVVQASRLFLIGFFIVHYGIFMLVHLMFLLFFLVSETDPLGALATVALGGAAYFLSHGYSFVVNFLDQKGAEKAKAKSLMMAPYPRIFLMHFVVFLGAFFGLPALFLVAGKTFFDLASHLFEHGWLVGKGFSV
ncbi:MAG: DUF6498-containing protein, partial [Candidatus Micrarchaeota archaeon]|nr:DUF6498-containing protein [Candidatus Micrarchaeota archaeon]